MRYIKVQTEKVSKDYAGPTFRNYGDWMVLVTSKVAMKKLHEDDSFTYGILVTSGNSPNFFRVLHEAEESFSETELDAKRPPEWDWLFSQENGDTADGRPAWAVRSTVAGYE